MDSSMFNNCDLKSPALSKKIADFTPQEFIDYYNKIITKEIKTLKSPHGLYLAQDLYLAATFMIQNGHVEVVEIPEIIVAHGKTFKLLKLIIPDIVPSLPNDTVDYDRLIMIGKKHLQLLNSAKGRGKDFNLTHADVAKLLDRKTCYYSGVPFSDSDFKYTRTIDRKDNTKGYVKGNVVACTYQMNQLKNMLLESSMDKHDLFRISHKILVKFTEQIKKEM